MVTPKLWLRVGKKMDQLSKGGQVPRILVITSEHPKIQLVFNRTGVVNLFVSDWTFCVPLSDPSAVFQFTDLNSSVFFRKDKANPARLRPIRRCASAVLLISIHPGGVQAIGVITQTRRFHWTSRLFLKSRCYILRLGLRRTENSDRNGLFRVTHHSPNTGESGYKSHMHPDSFSDPPGAPRPIQGPASWFRWSVRGCVVGF